MTFAVLLFACILVIGLQGHTEAQNTPPHCTQVTKDTDYESKFKYDYPVGYLVPGQKEAYQRLFCVNPAAVNKAVTRVCDWVAPPQVQFNLGDDYMHVVRQDPTERYLGNAVITTYQFCGHNISYFTAEAAQIKLKSKQNVLYQEYYNVNDNVSTVFVKKLALKLVTNSTF